MLAWQQMNVSAALPSLIASAGSNCVHVPLRVLTLALRQVMNKPAISEHTRPQLSFWIKMVLRDKNFTKWKASNQNARLVYGWCSIERNAGLLWGIHSLVPALLVFTLALRASARWQRRVARATGTAQTELLNGRHIDTNNSSTSKGLLIDGPTRAALNQRQADTG